MYETVGYTRVARKSACAEGDKVHCGLFCKSESMTDQQFTRSSKITSVLERYKRTGLMPHRVKPPIPFEQQTRPDLNDYQAVVEAKDQYLDLINNGAVSEATAPAVEPQNGATAAPAAEKETSHGTDDVA